MLTDIVLVALGLVGLFLGGDWLVKGVGRLASSFGVSSLVIGLTVVAFGTSAPELLVSLNAAFQEHSDIVIGNILGSNIANIGLILGLTGLLYPIAVQWQLIRREIPIMIGVCVAALLFALDGSISQIDGLIMFIGFIGFTAFSYLAARRDQREIAPELDEFEAYEHLVDQVNRRRELGRLVLGIGVLVLGARLMVDGAVSIASDLGVSELIIGITVVAVGTSLPELATSFMAALRKESDIAIGNVVGSNVANILMILGLTSIFRPIGVEEGLIRFEFPVMIGFSTLLLPFSLNRRLDRWQAGLLLLGYIAFTAASFLVLR